MTGSLIGGVRIRAMPGCIPPRSIVRGLAAVVALVLAIAGAGGDARAQTITNVLASQTTYSAAGQSITINYHFNSGSRPVTSVTMTSTIGAAISCPGPWTSNGSGGHFVTCTATYTTTASDAVAGSITEKPTFELISGSNKFSGTYALSVRLYNTAVSPVITGISPLSGPTTGGTQITITGANFTGATAVSLGGTAVASFTVDSPTRITAITAPRAAFNVDVTVTTPLETGTRPTTFIYTQVAQSITFAKPADTAFTSPPPALTATASSGLAVSYVSLTPSTCTVTGSSLAFVSIGTCTISAQQAGNAFYAFAPAVSQSFTILTGGNTIYFPRPSDAQYGSAPPALAASASSGLPVTYTSSTPGICTVSPTGALTMVGVGTCTLTSSQPGNGTVPPATPVTQSFSIIQGNNTITFIFPPNTLLSDPPPILGATTSSGLPVSYVSNSLGVCTVTPEGVLAFVSSGSCTVTASQAGNAFYFAATSQQRTFAVLAGVNQITFNKPADTLFTSPPPVLDATATSNLPITYSSLSPNVCTITSSGSITFLSIGSCVVWARQFGNNVYLEAPAVTQSFAVLPAGNVVSFPVPLTTRFSAAPPLLQATASSGLPVSYVTATPSVCTVTQTGSVSFVSVGTCSITASQPGTSTIPAATPVTQSFEVTPGINIINFPRPPDTLVGAPPPTLTATATSGLPVTYSSTSLGICTVTSGGVVSFVTPGACTIVASQEGNANYLAAVAFPRTFNILRTDNTITFARPADTPFNLAPPTLSASATSGLPVTYLSATTSVCAVSSSGSITFITIGSCTITALQTGDTQYAAATPVSQTFSILPGGNIISFLKPANTAMSSAPPVLSATASSGLTVSYSSNSPEVCTATAQGALTLVAVGTCSITASQPGDGSVPPATSVTQTFTVTVGINVINFPKPINTPFTSPPPNLTASASSSLPVTYSSSTPGVCTVTPTGTLSFVSVGACWITASQAGNISFVAATPVTQAFSVLQGTNLISFPKPPDTPFTSTPPTLQAFASSGLPIVYGSNTPAVCTTTPAGEVTFVAIGTCIFTAFQQGNESFAIATAVPQSFQVLPGGNVISFPRPVNTPFSSTPPRLTASASSALAVIYASNSPEVCTVTTVGTLRFVAVGTCSLTASQPGNETVPPAAPVTQTFNITLGQNGIVFVRPANTTNTSPPPTLTATAVSNLPVSYTSNSTSVCTVTQSGTMAFVSTGLCSITATQDGNSNWAAALPVTQTFSILNGDNVITFAKPSDTPFNLAPPVLGATASSGLQVTYITTTASVCTVSSGGAITFVSLGTCSITAQQSGNGTYVPATNVIQTFQILPGGNTINFPRPVNTPFSSAPPALAATASSGLTVSYSSSSPSVCTVTAGGAITFVAIGSCTITAAQPGDGSVPAASPVTQTFTVLIGANTISFPRSQNTVVTDPPPALNAVASSTLPVSYTSNTAPVCTVTPTGTLTLVSPGTCSITATQAGNANFSAATPTTSTFQVLAGVNTISFSKPPDTLFTSLPPTLNATATSGLPVTFTTGSPGVCTVTSVGVVTFVSVGTCTIAANQLGSSIWLAAPQVVQQFAVMPSSNVISFAVPEDTAFSSPPPTLTATASSALPVTYASNAPAVCTVTSTGVLTFVAVGTCSITARQSGNGSYAAATPVTQTFSVTPGLNTVTFNAPADTQFTSVPPVLGAVASSGLPIVYMSTTTNVCTVTTAGVLTFQSGGLCSITATQPGNALYAAAAPVGRSFTVLAGTNTIAFPTPPNTAFTSPPPPLTATASSGLPISYSSSTTTVCTVSAAGALSFGSTGTCTITASQPGNGSYAAASPVARSFSVLIGANLITFPKPLDTPYSSSPPVLTATASSGLPVSYVSATPAVCTATSGGVVAFVTTGQCTINAHQAGNTNYAAATPVAQTFGILAGANVITFPKPADTTFGTTAPTLTATASSGLPVTYGTNTSSVCSVTSGGTVTLLAAGTCAITANQSGNAVYSAAVAAVQSFTVLPGTNTITFATPADTPFNATPPTLAASSSSGLPVSFVSTSPAVCTVTGQGTLTHVAGGTCSITASQAGSAAWNAANPITQTYSVLPGVQSISFPQPADTPFTSTPPTLAATASSGLAVAYSSSTVNVCTVTPAGALTFVAGGACIITASQPGNGSWSPAAIVTRSFTVQAGNNQITFIRPLDTPLTSPPPVLVATATSGLPVSVASTSPLVCTVSASGTLAFVSAGTCLLTASQGGNGSFQPATPVSQSFSVLQGANTISFPKPANVSLGATPPTLAATSSSGLAVTYAAGNPAVCTVSPTGTITLVSAGVCSISATQAGDANFVAATSVVQAFTVNPGTQTIAFPRPADTPLTSSVPALTATASSGLDVSYVSTTPAVCTATTTGLLAFVSAGTCSITASQAGNANWQPATPVVQSFAVQRGTNSITFPRPADTSFTATPPTLGATATSGLAISYTSGTTGVCTVTPTGIVAFVAAGNCTITAAQAGSTSYVAATPVTQTFAVIPGANVIGFTKPADTSFTAAPPTLGATASSGLPVSYSSGSPTVCTVTAAGAVSFMSAGTCSITASQPGDARFAAAKTVTQTFSIAGGANTIAFQKPADTPFTSTPPRLVATATSGLAVTFTSNSTAVCNVTPTGTVSFVAGGTCSITAAQGGNASFAAATSVTQVFAVTPGVNSITFLQPADTAISSTPPTLSATASSGLPVELTSGTPGVCTVTKSGALTLVSAGTCTITAAQAGSVSYAVATPVSRSFAVRPGTQTISFPAPPTTQVTGVPPVLNATASSGLAVSYASSTTAVCTVTSTGTLTFVAPGNCTITASQAGDARYTAAPNVIRTFAVTQGTQTISFPKPADTSFGATPPTLAATASSGLAVTYTSATTGVCTVTAQGGVQFITGGTCTITAAQAGNATWAAASPATQSFTITASGNVIAFTKPADTPLTSTPPTLGARASSGLPVSFASTTPTVCSVSPTGTLALLAAGNCSIVASQAGNASFAAATPVTQTFAVTSGVQTITFAKPANTAFTSTPPRLSATATSGLAVTYASTTPAVCTVTPTGTITFVSAGACSITASQAGSTNYAAASPVTQSFDITASGNVISFSKPADVLFTDTPPTLGARASSGLPVTYTSNSAPVCTVTAAGALTFVATGTCSITAAQAGNGNFTAATPVTQTFAIKKVQTSIGLTASVTTVPTGKTVTASATIQPPTAAGTVTFTNNGSVVCSNVAVVSGIATCTATLPSSTTVAMAASFSGNAVFAPSSTVPAVSASAAAEAERLSRTQSAQAISQGLRRRNDLLASNMADDQRQIDRLNEAGGRGTSIDLPMGQIIDGPITPRVGGPDSADMARLRFGTGLRDTRGMAPWESEPYPVAAMRGATHGDLLGDGGAVRTGPVRMQGSLEGGTRFGFATSLRDMVRFAAAEDARRAAAAGAGFSGAAGTRFIRPNPFDIWIEGRFTGFRDANNRSDVDGHLGMLSFGADYVLNRSFLVGAMVQLDDFEMRAPRQSIDMRGKGWMAGPYTTVRLGENVFWQAKALWGQSDNSARPAGAASEQFETQRWLASTTLAGRWALGDWSFRPSASIAYMEDVAASHRNAQGVIVPDVTSRLGQTKVGPEVGYRWQVGDMIVEPRGGMQVIWNFANDATAPGIQFGNELPGAPALRGRAELGLRASNAGFDLDLSGSYDGVGTSNYSAMTGRANVRIPLGGAR